MKQLKLFFALFAMLALGVGNAWAEGTWTLVTSASNLAAGDKVVIVAKDAAKALSTTQNTNNRAQADVTKSGDVVTLTSSVQELTLEAGKTSGTFAFNTGSGYLYAASSSKNYLKTEKTLSANSSWNITIATTGVATIKATGSNTRNWLRYNKSNNPPIFSCYSSGQADVCLYKYVEEQGGDEGNEETVVSLTDDQLKWSAATAEATMGAANTFPTLTNTLGLTVAYDSSNKDAATIAADGTITLVAPGTTTISAKFAGGEVSGTTYAAKTVTYALTVLKAPATPTDNVYIKVTSDEGLTNGEYLIVYEDATNTTPAPVAFNGALATKKLDVASNYIEVSIASNTIAGNTDIDAAIFTIDATAGTIQTKDGYYIGQTSDANGLASSTSKTYENEISIGEDGNATIKSGGAYLRYNSDANNWRFRYYRSSSYTGQKAIALYKKASKHAVTIADCTNGSVSANVANGAEVLSGTQITLSNSPETNYKLTAYDVYKTGDNTTKVTVTDGKFIMPEHDVTISATFELAKTLTGLDITTPATQTTFWQGEAFNHDGLKVTAHFDGADDEDVTDEVTVTGSTATAGAAVEVTISYNEGATTKTATYNITVKAIPNTKETAYTVAEAYDIIDKLTTAEGVYIKGIVSQVDEYLTTYKSITYWISDDGTTTNQLQVYSGKGLEKADFANINGVSKADQVIVCGNLKNYKGTYEFDKNNYLAEHTKTTKADPELSYTTTEYNVNLGEAFTAPTLNNPYTLAVTYSSNNEDVATVGTDGAVTIKAAGTVVITASFTGNDDYVAGEASYTINITDPNQLEVTFDATIDSDANNTARGEGEITKAPITFACTDGILGNGSEYRIYANAKATFSAAEGYIITKIVLTSTASGTADNGPAHLDEEDGTYTYEEKVGTWVGEAYIVTLSASKQVRAKTITVYYKQDNRVDAGLAWNPATISLTVGDAFTAPTFSNPKSVTGITFASDNEALATVNDAGVISLVTGKTGTANITATFTGNATYKPAEVKCKITVDHRSEDVVILAKCKDQYYALVAEYVEGKTDVLQALPVEYVGGKIYNVETEDQASIIWKRVVVDGKTTFKNGDNYLSAVNSAALKLATDTCDWVFEGDMYKIEGSTRTILYYTSTGGFKNYATTNMSKDGVNGEYSSAAITVAPVFADGDAYHRTTTPNKFGTICLPFGSANYYGATFYEFVGSETGKVYLGSVTTLEAGVPYIFEASANELAVYSNGTTTDKAGNKNGLHGTFDNDTEVAVGNYILKDNKLCQAADICYVNANRAYIVMSEVPNGKPNKVAGRKYIGMDVQGENVETGVEDLFTTDAPVKVIENGQLIIIRDGLKYNVQGQVIR